MWRVGKGIVKLETEGGRGQIVGSPRRPFTGLSSVNGHGPCGFSPGL